MRKPCYHILFLASCFLLLSLTSNAQQLKLGNNPTQINPASVLELQSANQGLRLTRADTAAVNSVISTLSPALQDSTNGMVIFQVSDSSIYYRAGGFWKRIAITDSVGIQSLNGDISRAQTIQLVIGTNNYATPTLVDSTNGNHYLFLPYASSTYTGLVNTAAQTFGGGKTFADSLTLGQDLVASGSSGISGQVLRSLGIGLSPEWENMLLDSLYNVRISSPTNGQFLQYNGSNWMNVTPDTSNTSNFFLKVRGELSGTNGWLYNNVTGVGQVDSSKYSTLNFVKNYYNGTAPIIVNNSTGAISADTTSSNSLTTKNFVKNYYSGIAPVLVNNSTGAISVDTTSSNSLTTKNFVKNYYSGTGLINVNNSTGVISFTGTQNPGTVTSVGLSLPNIFTVSGSPVTSSGTLTGTLASQNQNLVFASPNGSSGTPLFRALVPADVPVLNQNTTGQAGSVANALTFNSAGTGAASPAIYNGSSAQTISYNTIGAPSTTGANASGTWGINISGNAATATNSIQWNGATNSITAPNIGDVLTYNGTNWINSSSSGNYWSLNGNNNVTASSYIGTTSTAGYFPLIFKVLGQQVGYLGTPGTSSNVAFGFGSSANFKSVAIGGNAVATNNESVVLGYTSNGSAFQSIAIGEANVSAQGAIGIGIGTSSSSYQGIAIGAGAQTSSQNSAMAIGVGASASGYQSTALGSGATASAQNSTAIGNGATANVANTLILGNGSVNVGIRTSNPTYPLQVAGAVGATAFNVTSDIRYKKNMQELRNVLSAIDSLHGYTYFFRTKEFKDKRFPSDKQIGMIAQEVEKYFPELVSTDKNGYKSLNYAQFTAVLLEAVKEQQAEINALKKENEQNKKTITDQLNALQQKVETLEKMVEKK